MKNIKYIKLLFALAPLTGAIMPLIACKSDKKDQSDKQKLRIKQSKLYTRSILYARENETKPEDILKALFENESKNFDQKILKINDLFKDDAIKKTFFGEKNPSDFKRLITEENDEKFDDLKYYVNKIISMISEESNLGKVLKRNGGLLSQSWDLIKDKIKDSKSLNDFGDYITIIKNNVKELVDDIKAEESYANIIAKRIMGIKNLFLEIFNKNKNNNDWSSYNEIFKKNPNWIETIEKKWKENEFNKINWSMRLGTLLVPLSILIVNIQKTNPAWKNIDIGSELKKKYQGFEGLDLIEIKQNILNILKSENILMSSKNILELVSFFINDENIGLGNLLLPMIPGVFSKFKENIPPDLKLILDINDLKNLDLGSINLILGALLNILDSENAKNESSEMLQNFKKIMENIFKKISSEINKYIPEKLSDSELKEINGKKLNELLSDLSELLDKVGTDWSKIFDKLKKVTQENFINTIYEILGFNGESITSGSILDKIQNIINKNSLALQLINHIVQNIEKKIKRNAWEKDIKTIAINFFDEKIINNQSEDQFILEYNVKYEGSKDFKFRWSIINEDFKVIEFEQL